MLADYPVIVDYNFSPVQSPLFHHELMASDDFLVPNHCKEVGVFLEENDRPDQNHTGLFYEEDDISSISASIHTSESFDHDNDHAEGFGEGSGFPSGANDVGTISDTIHKAESFNCEKERSEGLGSEGSDFSTGTSTDLRALEEEGVAEPSIPVGGVDHALAEEGLFCCEENDLLNSNLISTLPDGSLHIAENVSLSLLDSMEEDDLDLCIGSTVEVSEVTGHRSKVTDHRQASSSLVSSSSSISSSPSKQQRKHKKKMEDKRWNEMNTAERREVAEHLSTVLRSLLGPRERLEVLAMITGQERSRLSDRDFVIESDMLNESILARLETFLEENEMKGEASDSELVVAKPERKRSALNSRRRKCASLPASPQHRGSFVENTPVLGRKKKSLRTWRRRTRKEYRQAAKERRSGLFQQEEVISLSQRTEENEGEEEVDILD